MTAAVLPAEPRPNRLPLSRELRESTARAHGNAENSDFITELIGGRRDAGDFTRLQEQSLLLYSALERAARAVRATVDLDANPALRVILDPRLERAGILAADLDRLHGNPGWRGEVRALPGTARYVARLEAIGAAVDLPRLLAHHYVRYLGDMSGGQVVARMMERHYDVPREALGFYRFEGIGKLKPHKDAYRAALDELRLDDDARRAMLAEAEEAFRHNMRMFASLDEAA